jgi:hypothetical protein
MEIQNELIRLKSDILCPDTELDKKNDAARRLHEIGSEGILDFWIDLLDVSNDYCILRNYAALSLLDIRNSRAVEPLINTILKRGTINYNGTLVYTLSFFNCSYKFKEIFQILFYQGYEAKCIAANILSDQEFEFTRQDIIDIKAMWEQLKLHPDESYLKSKDLIDESVEGYLSYLE